MGMRKAIVLAALVAVGVQAGAWEWPVKDATLAADFAADWHGSFLAGIYVRSTEVLVRAVHGGELVFYSAGQRRDHRAFPMTRNGLLVVSHDNGLRSSYLGLQSDSVRDFAAKSGAGNYAVKQNEIIGMMPAKADGSPEPLFIQIADTRLGGLINPLAVLPRLADERPPAIAGVEYVVEGGGRLAMRDRAEIQGGKFQLYVQARDAYGLQGRGTLIGLPQDIKVLLNGVLQYDSSKQALYMRPDNTRELTLSRNPFGSFSALHPQDNFLYMGEYQLSDGVNRLEIRTADLQGNRSSVSFRLLKPAKPVGG